MLQNFIITNIFDSFSSVYIGVISLCSVAKEKKNTNLFKKVMLLIQAFDEQTAKLAEYVTAVCTTLHIRHKQKNPNK